MVLRTVLFMMKAVIWCSWWRHLSDDHNRACETIFHENLDRHAREGDAFLHRIVQETIPGCNILNQTVRDNRCSGSTRRFWPTKNSTHRVPLGVMLTIVGDVNVHILVHFQEKGQTVTSAQYSDMLVKELKPAIWSKCRGIPSIRVLLLHHKANPHTAAHTVDTLRALKFEVLKHPPYNLDLAPLDIQFFGHIKEHLLGQKLADDNELMRRCKVG